MRDDEPGARPDDDAHGDDAHATPDVPPGGVPSDWRVPIERDRQVHHPHGIPDPNVDGPLTRAIATAYLDRGAELVARGDFQEAFRYYRRVVGFDDAAVTAAALLGLGEVLHRLDRDEDAMTTWQQVLALPESPSTYAAWRNVAAARVREGDLRGALDAYRQAEKRAPDEDKAEIASRLGWLSKETGDQRGASRYFSRARGDAGLPLSAVVIGLTVVVSLSASLSSEGELIYDVLQLDKPALAAGELWRLVTVALLHAPLQQMPFHLLFNMYALWLTGPLVEQLYGRWMFLAFYVVTAIAGSIGSFAFSDGPLAVGASGAIFGLFGILLAAARTHHPVVDRRGRMLLGQIGGLIVFNLIFGFALGGMIDNAAHVGGLVAGLWLGFLIPPGRVATLRSMWARPAGVDGPGPAETTARVLGILALVALLIAGYVLGLSRWS